MDKGESINLNGPLTIKNIKNTRDILAVFLNDETLCKNTLTIHIDDEAECDLTLVQLLLSARKTAIARNFKIALEKSATGQLLDTLERGGFLQNLSPEDANFWLHDGVMK